MHIIFSVFKIIIYFEIFMNMYNHKIISVSEKQNMELMSISSEGTTRCFLGVLSSTSQCRHKFMACRAACLGHKIATMLMVLWYYWWEWRELGLAWCFHAWLQTIAQVVILLFISSDFFCPDFPYSILCPSQGPLNFTSNYSLPQVVFCI